MSKFNVTASELRSAIQALRENNTQFKGRVTELGAKQQELASQWQGDANTAFNAAFQNDKDKWEIFSQLVEQYIQALEQILQTYEAAEQANTSTASTRSY